MSQMLRGAAARRWAQLPVVILVPLLAGTLPVLATAPAGPLDGRTGARGEIPKSDRAILRAEYVVAQMLARLDEDLGLGTGPDGSSEWPARLAASLDTREEGSAAKELLSLLAMELRALGVEWSLGGGPDGRPDGRPDAATSAGRERAEGIQRIREIVELVYRKLGIGAPAEGSSAVAPGSLVAPRTPAPPQRHPITRKFGSDVCEAAPPLSLGFTEGSTFSATNDGGASCGGPTASPDVWYVFTPPEDGTYTFQTVEPDFDAFDTVLSLHAGCPLSDGNLQELACSDDVGPTLFSSVSHLLPSGEPVWVRVSGYDGAVGRYRLRATLGRTIRGTVTEEATGAPVTGATVEVLAKGVGEIAEVSTDDAGEYAAGVFASPELYVQVRDPRFVTELYDDHPCPLDRHCSLFSADPVSVSSADAEGVDVALVPGGTIAGSVTLSDSADPSASSASVFIYNAAGAFLGGMGLRLGGAFEITSVPPGEYFLKASAHEYQAEVWPDVPCPFSCDVTTGGKILVEAGGRVTGIDFVLSRLGRIEGTVTRADNGAPVGSGLVALYDETGGFARSSFIRSDGSYVMTQLPEGEYFARTSTSAYFDLLFDKMRCEPDCEVTFGTPIAVELDGTTQGIDFSLIPRASIEGTVTDAASGDPLDVSVSLHDGSGDLLANRSTDPFDRGSYRFLGLEAGTYFVRTRPRFTGAGSSHENELYDDIRCEPDCDVTAGTPVVTTATSQVTDVHFALERRGWISGRVVDAATGEPVSWVNVGAYRLDGTQVGTGLTESDGTFEIPWIPAGSYRVGTSSGLHRDEMYDDVPCLVPCDRTTGATVNVQSSLETPGIDFALSRLGSLSGTVRSAATGAFLSGDVQLLDAAGTVVRSDDAFSGFFTIDGIDPGTYYLRAEEDFWEEPFQDELYADVPCQPDCDLSEGTPLVVALGTTLTGLDFSLAPCPVDSRKEVASTTITTSFKALACARVTASSVTLAPGADVTFRSGRSIVLGDGFRVEEGARFRAVIEPTWSGD